MLRILYQDGSGALDEYLLWGIAMGLSPDRRGQDLMNEAMPHGDFQEIKENKT